MNNFIAASIIAADFWNLEKEFVKLRKSKVSWIHYDIMDGHYVPNITIGSCELDSLQGKNTIPLDLHFMVSNPDEIVPEFVKRYKNSNIANITVHVETCKNKKKLSDLVRKAGIGFGLAIHPSTSIHELYKFLGIIDLALVMTVKPGFAGQKLIKSCIKKVKLLKSYMDKNETIVPIQVDGGIKKDNVSYLVQAGANIIVSGSGIFNTKDYKKTVLEMSKYFSDK